jgi:hypothetical protein
MNNIVTFGFVTVIAYLFYRYIYDGTIYVTSNIDNKRYKVRASTDDERKADLLAMLYTKMQIIVSTLRNDPVYNTYPNVKRLADNWDKGITIKETGNMEKDAAYVINKQHMSFCLERYDTFEDLNLMTYVCIHELAHVMSVETGHNSEFISNFEFLLNYAKKLKYIDPLTNKEMPLYIELSKVNTADNYCGVKITNSIN